MLSCNFCTNARLNEVKTEFVAQVAPNSHLNVDKSVVVSTVLE